MSLSNPRILYGVHSVSPYRRSDKTPYGILKVIGSANLALTSEQEQLFAGSNKFAWASESKTISTEFTAKVKAYPGFLFELFLGATVTDTGIDTAGATSALTNQKGTSVQKATTGIASVSVIPSTGAANLKFGGFLVVAMSATTVNIYGYSDIDYARGTDIDFEDDSLKLLAANVTIADTGATQDVASLGIRLTSGSGTIAFVVGDTASFEVKPPSVKSSEIIVGKTTSSFPEFGAILLAAKRSTGEMFEINAHKCSGSGMPIPLEENAFSQPELKMICQYDAPLDRVFTIRHIEPS